MDSILIFGGILIFGPPLFKKLGIKGKPFHGVIVSLTTVVCVSFLISYMLYKALPRSEFTQGDSLPIIPFIIGMVTLFLVGLLIKNKKRLKEKISKDISPILGWSIYGVVWVSIVLSKYGFMLSLYSPKVFNSTTHNPGAGVLIFLVLSVLIAIALYKFSFFELSQAPELSFSTSFLTIMYCIFETTLSILLLIYGLIGDFRISYPYYASIMTTGYIPLIITMFLIVYRKNLSNKQQSAVV